MKSRKFPTYLFAMGVAFVSGVILTVGVEMVKPENTSFFGQRCRFTDDVMVISRDSDDGILLKDSARERTGDRPSPQYAEKVVVIGRGE
jgi:hypothetical protein